MKSAFDLENLNHHAYLLVGGEPTCLELLSVLEKRHKVIIHGNPDYYEHHYDNFTIDDARELKSMHEMRPTGTDGRKIFIVSMNGVTIEAQNALLKLLEEPAEYATFFLIVPSAHLLLPTVKSRLMKIDTQEEGSGGGVPSDDILKLTKIFVTSGIKEQLDIVKALVEDISKEKKTKQDAIIFLDAIQAHIYETKGVKGVNNGGYDSLEAIEVARKYANDRSPSLKMLLEYVAMNAIIPL